NGMTFGRGFAFHLLGEHEGAEADANRRPIVSRVTGYGEHSRRLLFALTAAARGRWDDAGRELATAAAHVRRYRYPLTLNDCIIACGALAVLGGRLERACTLLAAVVDRSFVRSPEMWAGYLHYRPRARRGARGARARAHPRGPAGGAPHRPRAGARRGARPPRYPRVGRRRTHGSSFMRVSDDRRASIAWPKHAGAARLRSSPAPRG